MFLFQQETQLTSRRVPQHVRELFSERNNAQDKIRVLWTEYYARFYSEKAKLFPDGVPLGFMASMVVNERFESYKMAYFQNAKKNDFNDDIFLISLPNIYRQIEKLKMGNLKGGDTEFEGEIRLTFYRIQELLTELIKLTDNGNTKIGKEHKQSVNGLCAEAQVQLSNVTKKLDPSNTVEVGAFLEMKEQWKAEFLKSPKSKENIDKALNSEFVWVRLAAYEVLGAAVSDHLARKGAGKPLLYHDSTIRGFANTILNGYLDFNLATAAGYGDGGFAEQVMALARAALKQLPAKGILDNVPKKTK